LHMNSDAGKSSGSKAQQKITVIGFGQRLKATVTDGFLVVFISLVVAAGVGVVLIVLEFYAPRETLPVTPLIALSGIVISVLYYVRSWARSGQTVGKMWIKAKVVGADGQPVSIGRALLRYLGYIVSAVLLSLGFLWIAFDRKRQGLHDKIAGTYVVKSDAEFSDAAAVEFVPAESRPGWIWLVVWIATALWMPAALLGALWFLGPFIGRAVTTLLQGLFS
jgi:uncharacterized RDD family membrane protein YckC